MKILFLHNELNAKGGVYHVNKSLMQGFIEQGHEIFFIAIRKRPQESVSYPKQVQIYLVNEEKEWKVPLYSQALALLKQGHGLQFISQILARQVYDFHLNQDYKKCQHLIEEIQPDWILCTHYECLSGIPTTYLKKTIHEYHTDYSQILAHPSAKKFLFRYVDRIAWFVWLSHSIMNQAVEDGLKPSTYMYNPLGFETSRRSDVINSHEVVFIGRFSPEKRVSLLIRLFLQANEQLNHEYVLKIYGLGEMDQETANLIQENACVQFMGSTQNPKEVFLSSALLLMTSSFEGMPLTVLEAAECGVPTLAMNFGASATEIILQGKTGIVVEQDDQEAFVSELVGLLSNSFKLQEMSLEVKQFAKQFHQEAVIQKWSELLKRCEQ